MNLVHSMVARAINPLQHSNIPLWLAPHAWATCAVLLLPGHAQQQQFTSCQHNSSLPRHTVTVHQALISQSPAMGRCCSPYLNCCARLWVSQVMTSELPPFCPVARHAPLGLMAKAVMASS